MIQFIFSIIGILLTIAFVVGTHEAAHFYVARLLHVKVLRFSIGFGKRLLTWHDRQGTEYALSLIPLGGYVKMLDENEENVAAADLPYAFNRQPFYKKFFIILAGPATNILSAFILYWIIFMVGFTTVKPIIGEVKSRSIAAEAGLNRNDQIIAIDGRPTAGWTSVIFRMVVHVGDKDHLNIEVLTPQQQKKLHMLDISNWHIGNLTPDPLGSLGITPYQPEIPLIIGVIATKSPALASPLKLGDKIIAIDNKSVTKWEDVIQFIVAHPDARINVTVERNGKQLSLPVVLGAQGWYWKSGYLGIAPKFKWPENMLQKVQYGPLPAVARAYQEIVDFSFFNLLLFGKIITGKISLQSLGGPITIFESAGDALNSGFFSFIAFLAFLSISIGIINLLPIPGLDGGHLLLYIVEAIIRRSIPETILSILFRLGYLLILFILFQAVLNDILRLY